jgi:uncharacterized protein YndB with AHSA1/START domain
MATSDIRHEIRIKAPPGAVYQALTDVQKLAQWWIPDTRGQSEAGKVLEFWFGETACQLMKVASLESDRLVRWQATDSDLSDWAGTEVEFRILPQDDQTRLRFRHSGYRDDVEAYPDYSMSWAVFLLSLKQLLEEGEGFPFPNKWVRQ